MDLPISFLSLQTKQRYLIITHAVLPGQMYPPVRGKENRQNLPVCTCIVKTQTREKKNKI